MRKLLFILLMVSNFAVADMDIGVKYASFFEIVTDEALYDGNTISLTGYLREDDGSYFFCFSKEVCATEGKERLMLQLKDISEGVKQSIMQANDCSVKLEGRYSRHDGVSAHLNFVGYLKPNNHPFHGSREAAEKCLAANFAQRD